MGREKAGEDIWKERKIKRKRRKEGDRGGEEERKRGLNGEGTERWSGQKEGYGG